MSESEETINEFEQLLAAVTPAEPKGNAMQIMYAAGQQSVGNSHATRSPQHRSGNWIWKAATLISTSAAACLLMILTMTSAPTLSPKSSTTVATNGVQQPNTIEVISVVQPAIASEQAQGSKQLDWFRRPELPNRIAMSQPQPSSIDMFDDFELKPLTATQQNRFRLDINAKELQ